MSITSLKHNWLMKVLHPIKHSDFQLELAAFMLSNYYFLMESNKLKYQDVTSLSTRLSDYISKFWCHHLKRKLIVPIWQLEESPEKCSNAFNVQLNNQCKPKEKKCSLAFPFSWPKSVPRWNRRWINKHWKLLERYMYRIKWSPWDRSKQKNWLTLHWDIPIISSASKTIL